jgi:hypothetical protein
VASDTERQFDAEFETLRLDAEASCLDAVQFSSLRRNA